VLGVAPGCQVPAQAHRDPSGRDLGEGPVLPTAPESPAASANGMVSPSDIPIATSRTLSLAVKCRSMCGVCGMTSSAPS